MYSQSLCNNNYLSLNDPTFHMYNYLRLTEWLMKPGSLMRIQNGYPIYPILSQINPISRIDTNLFNIHSNIVLQSTPRLP